MKKRRNPVKHFNDIVGLEVGYLTVSKYSHSERNSQGVGNHHYYECICKCSNIHTVRRKSLLKNEVRSCGCLSKEVTIRQNKERKRKPSTSSSLISLYNVHKNQAKYREIDFSITREEHEKLVLDNCHYCGATPNNFFNPKWLEGELKYNGMDRKYGDKGYEINNLVTCCLICNKAKNTMNYDEFKEYIKRLISFNS